MSDRPSPSPWRWVGVLYLVILATSHLVRWRHPYHPGLSRGEQSRLLHAVRRDRETRDTVRIAYLDSDTAGLGRPTVVLVHGSPGSNRELFELGQLLAPEYRVLIPDMPGFGGSTWSIPDYSFRAHAHYLLQLLDSLGIRQAHFLGFSMGGGVVLSASSLAPERVRSLTMLSAIGPQEFELLGDYWLNHAVHGLQLVGLWALHEAVPHFGAWDNSFLGHSYARNFYDSDQRPLRAALQRWQGPMVIIQGDHDPLVPPGAALEMHRVVPQSTLHLMDGNHFMAFQRPEELAPMVRDFLGTVEAGTALTRATADPDRVRQASLPLDPSNVPHTTGFSLTILLLLLAASTLLSEDLACIGAGLLVARGTLPFLPATLACLIGITGGDLLLFVAGRLLGRAAIKRAPFKWFIHPEDVERTSVWFHRRGLWIIVSTRFLPGTRLPTYVAAGILRTSAWRFAGMFLLAAAIWTPILVGLAALYGAQMGDLLAAYNRYASLALLAGAVTLTLLVRLAIAFCSYRGRRLLLSRWRRIRHWEFWPPWVVYPPVIATILRLALRYRSLTVFTAVNPGMPGGGGFAGESKAEILNGLAAAGDAIVPFELLPAGTDRIAAVERFQARHGLTWPLVLKPDIGERGSGVAIVRSMDDARAYVEAVPESPVLVQAYQDGLEFGIFYYRLPDAPQGRILAVTEKRFPTVTGDGTATLERLILRDDRAVCMARYFLRAHAARLDTVPAAGEIVPLTELGTHARGALFLDATALVTPALTAEVDRISRTYRGFYFGRYDVRVPSIEALQAGRDLRIIELNGATSEATSIYDPRHSIFFAWRTLRAQWRLAFAIGDANRRAGAVPLTLTAVLALLQTHRAARRAHATAFSRPVSGSPHVDPNLA